MMSWHEMACILLLAAATNRVDAMQFARDECSISTKVKQPSFVWPKNAGPVPEWLREENSPVRRPTKTECLSRYDSGKKGLKAFTCRWCGEDSRKIDGDSFATEGGEQWDTREFHEGNKCVSPIWDDEWDEGKSCRKNKECRSGTCEGNWGGVADGKCTADERRPKWLKYCEIEHRIERKLPGKLPKIKQKANAWEKWQAEGEREVKEVEGYLRRILDFIQKYDLSMTPRQVSDIIRVEGGGVKGAKALLEGLVKKNGPEEGPQQVNDVGGHHRAHHEKKAAGTAGQQGRQQALRGAMTTPSGPTSGGGGGGDIGVSESVVTKGPSRACRPLGEEECKTAPGCKNAQFKGKHKCMRCNAADYDKGLCHREHPDVNYYLKNGNLNWTLFDMDYEMTATRGGAEQGELGDCYLIAAMNAVRIHAPWAIKDMFGETLAYKNKARRSKTEIPIYQVRFYIAGEPRHFAVDGMLPVDSAYLVYSKPEAYMQRNGKALFQVWPMVLEKAWAKIMYSYRLAGGGYSADVLTAMTGAPVTVYRPDTSFCPLPSQGDIPNAPNVDIWNALITASEMKYPMTAGAGCGEPVLMEWGVDKVYGIQSDHEYQIYQAREDKGGKRVVELWNPHGRGSHDKIVPFSWFVNFFRKITVAHVRRGYSTSWHPMKTDLPGDSTKGTLNAHYSDQGLEKRMVQISGKRRNKEPKFGDQNTGRLVQFEVKVRDLKQASLKACAAAALRFAPRSLLTLVPALPLTPPPPPHAHTTLPPLPAIFLSLCIFVILSVSVSVSLSFFLLPSNRKRGHLLYSCHGLRRPS